MLTIDPPPRSRMPGIACLQQRNVPRAFTAKTFSHTSSGVSGAFVVEPMPATLASTSTPFHRRCDLRFVPHVEPERGRAELFGDTVGLEVRDRDVEAVPGEPARDRCADSRTSTCHECSLHAIVWT